MEDGGDRGDFTTLTFFSAVSLRGLPVVGTLQRMESLKRAKNDGGD